MARTDKIDSMLQREISSIIQFDLNDPKIGFATVSEVDVAPDLSIAKVYVSFMGKNYKKRDGLEALRRSKGYIKTELSKRLKLRKIPDLTFVVDDSLDRVQHIEDIINRNKQV